MSDRIGSKMVILGCDIGVKDHCHFYDIACDFKHEQVQGKLTRANVFLKVGLIISFLKAGELTNV